jgi:2-polyprenyl-6-methoxyphenol hydroxylase-like FAD-dependent oxidoreductase
VAADRTAIIIGAGIGGLAAGVALRRAGWTVRIYERAAHARELGFGLALAPNALAALHELGIAEPVVRAASAIRSVEVRRADGHVLRRFDVPVGLPAVVALRPDLHGALLAASEDVVTLGRDAVSFEQSESDVTVRFRDGRSDTGTILIAADGVGSAFRRQLHPNEPPPTLTKYRALRGVAYGVSHHLGDLSGVMYLDAGIEAATIRASTDAVYWYMSLLADDVRDETPGAILAGRAPAFAPSFRAIVNATKADDVRFDRLYTREPLRSWGSRRVTLLGDAAHPVLPHTGQGAAQAMEDAVALALVLSRDEDELASLRRYEAVRQRRTAEFIALGPRLARITTTRSGLVSALRTVAIRLVPQSLMVRSAQRLQRDPHRDLRR